MKYTATLLIVLSVLLSLPLSAQTLPERRKTIDIGLTRWFTEEVDFKEVLTIAKKEKKLVLVAFSGNEHRQWKRLKKRVFNNEMIYQISREAVFYLVNIKRPKGKALAGKHRLLSSFVFKIFDSSGKLLNTNYFTNNYFVASKELVNWFFTVKEGRGPAPREKTAAIGGVTWHTEQNSIDHILRLADKMKKPVLLFYNDYWETQSRMIIKNIFEGEWFQSSAGRALLLNVDQSYVRAKDYVKRFDLKWPPTILMISPRGKEVERIQSGLRNYNANSFANWFADALAGDNRANLEKRVKNDPENRVAMMKLARKMDGGLEPAVIHLLRRVIRLNPDIYDPLTQEAHERLVVELHSRIDSLRGVEKKKYVKTFHEDFMTAYYSYYPDMFKYSMKGKLKKYNYVLTWLTAADNPSEGTGYFNDFCQAVEVNRNPSKIISYVQTYNHGIQLLLKLNRAAEAEKWLDKVLDQLSGQEEGLAKDDSKRINIRMMHYVLHLPFIKYYAGKGEIGKAEAYAKKTLQALSKTKRSKKLVPSIKERLAKTHGVFSGWFLAKIDSQLAGGPGLERRIRLLCDKAIILSKLGDEQDASGILRELVEHPFRDGEKKSEGDEVKIINYISNVMMNAGVVNDWTFELAKKAVALKPSFESHALLAMAYLERENMTMAIDHLETAARLSSNKWQRDFLNGKIELWKLF